MSKYAFAFRGEIIGIRDMGSREEALDAAFHASKELDCEPIYVVDLAEMLDAQALAAIQQPVPGVN